MSETNSEGITYPPIDQLMEHVDSKYRLVLFASKRARQINAYYSQLAEGLLENVGPLVETDNQEKPLSIAMREIQDDQDPRDHCGGTGRDGSPGGDEHRGPAQVDACRDRRGVRRGCRFRVVVNRVGKLRLTFGGDHLMVWFARSIHRCDPPGRPAWFGPIPH